VVFEVSAIHKTLEMSFTSCEMRKPRKKYFGFLKGQQKQNGLSVNVRCGGNVNEVAISI
jgi:hypothetical protein